MYDSFASDLESMDSQESQKNRDFEDFIATKQEELIELQKKLADAEKAKAEAELMLSEATQSYDDTEAQLKADIEFFDATKLACTGKSDQWKERKELRDAELVAVTQALDILSSDEARTLFANAINQPGVQQSFLQLINTHQSGIEDAASPPARKAYKIVKGLATKGRSLRLARLAATLHSSKVGHFDAVIQSIDTMIQDLKTESSDDIAKRDQCKDEYQSIESKSKDLKWKIKNNDATIARLDQQIADMEKEKEETLEHIHQVVDDITDLNFTRHAENEAYHEAKEEDEEAIKLLEEAKSVLAGFYKNNSIDLGPIQGGESGAGFLQVDAGPEFERSADDAPEAEFSHKGKRKGQAKGVIALLSHIIEDLHGEIAVAKKAEEAAQLEYEKQLQAATNLLKKLDAKHTNLEVSIAERGEKKTEEKEDKTQNEGDLKSEEKYKKDIEPDCNFILEKFSERAQKRTAEIEGLSQAKDYLAGYQERMAGSA